MLLPEFQAEAETLNLPCLRTMPVFSSQQEAFLIVSFKHSGPFWCLSRNRMALSKGAKNKCKLRINSEELMSPSGRSPLLALRCRVWWQSWIHVLWRQQRCRGVVGSSLVRRQLAQGTGSLPFSGAGNVNSGHAPLLWCPILQPFQAFPLPKMSIYTPMDHPLDVSNHGAPAQKTN